MRDIDMRRVWGLTWAGWLNCLLLQWLCLRLTRVVEADGTISAWHLRWGPIWRTGWSLPSRASAPSGHGGVPNPVFRTASEGRIITVHVIDPEAARWCNFVVDRSFELRTDLRCRSLRFASEPRRGFWRRVWGLPAKPYTLTLAGYRLTVDESVVVPAWGRIRLCRPPSFWWCLREALWPHDEDCYDCYEARPCAACTVTMHTRERIDSSEAFTVTGGDP